MDQKAPILIYYSFRGRAQPLRTLLCYLAVPFLEIHLNCLQQQRKILPPSVFQQIRSLKIDKDHVPALIHNGSVIYSQYEIMIYLCKYYKHQQLLGSTIQNRAKLHELLNIFFPQTKSLGQIYQYADYALSASQQEIDRYGNQLYEGMMNNSRYLKQLCQHLDLQYKPRFILQELTLIDFLFMESCVYVVGLFNKPQRITLQHSFAQNVGHQHFLDKPNAHYMQVIQHYLQAIQQQSFYFLYQNFLQSFSIVSNVLTPERIAALRKIWVGNPKFVQ